jgi:hypothetical protein
LFTFILSFIIIISHGDRDEPTVLFTTHICSLGEARDPIRKILGPEAGARLKPIWGLDAEGEIQGAWRNMGLPRLWCMIGKPFSSLEGKKK